MSLRVTFVLPSETHGPQAVAATGACARASSLLMRRKYLHATLQTDLARLVEIPRFPGATEPCLVVKWPSGLYIRVSIINAFNFNKLIDHVTSMSPSLVRRNSCDTPHVWSSHRSANDRLRETW